MKAIIIDSDGVIVHKCQTADIQQISEDTYNIVCDNGVVNWQSVKIEDDKYSLYPYQVSDEIYNQIPYNDTQSKTYNLETGALTSTLLHDAEYVERLEAQIQMLGEQLFALQTSQLQGGNA